MSKMAQIRNVPDALHTEYDATYIALAEALDGTVVTCDAPLAKAPGHRARIEAIEWGGQSEVREG